MKNFIVFWVLGTVCLGPVSGIAGHSGGDKSPDAGGALQVLFWNLENFFDWKDGGGGESDTEFSSFGERHWTRRRFETKCRSVAKSILYIAQQTGAPPDVIGVAEVESRYVLERLLDATPLFALGYGIVHFDSPDHRGIDCGLLYRKDRLRLASAEAVHVLLEDGSVLETRDILLARFVTEAGDSIAISVNHHPSKYGGAASGPKRQAAMRTLATLADRLSREGWRGQLAIGDFNDTPRTGTPLEGVYVNLAAPLARAGEGSLRFDGRWELIDQALCTPELAGRTRMEVVKLPFLMVRDTVHPGLKPLRTYSGPRYLGGVSDHCPVLVRILP